MGTRRVRRRSCSITPCVARTSFRRRSLSIGLYRKKRAPAACATERALGRWSLLIRRRIRSTERLNSRLAVAIEWTDGADGDRNLHAEGYMVDIGTRRLPCRGTPGSRRGAEAAPRYYQP